MNAVNGDIFLTICISAPVFFILGGLAGWLVSLLRNPKPQLEMPQPPPEEPSPGTPYSSPPFTDPEKIELARIYQQRADNQVFLEANGRLLRTPADVPPSERTSLVLAAEAIYRLLGQSSPRPEPKQPSSTSLPPIEWKPAPPTKIQKPSMNPADVLVRAVQAGQPRLDQPRSLVEQIDEVLQEMLAQSPLPAGKVHLSENESLGLEVRVNNQRYEGLDAVPDEAVRQIVRAAIAEWQRRSHLK